MTVEMAVRRELLSQFPELGERIYEQVHPPDAEQPLITYRRVGSGDAGRVYQEARIELTIKHPEYTVVKDLQTRINGYFNTIANTSLGNGDQCVWAFRVNAAARSDLFQGATRARLAVSELVVKYQG